MSTTSLFTKAIGFTAFVLLSAAPALRGQTCATVLQPYFASAVPGGHYPVFLKFSQHSAAAGVSDAAHVKYAAGRVTLQPGWVNTVFAHLILQSDPAFPVTTSSRLDITLSQVGFVTLQQKILNNPVGNFPPNIFAASCAILPNTGQAGVSALVWAVVGDTVYAITLSIGEFQPD